MANRPPSAEVAQGSPSHRTVTGDGPSIPGPDPFAMGQHLYEERHSFAIPTDEALALMALYAPLLEVGCGNGWWAQLLMERAVDVIAVDPGRGRNRVPGVVHGNHRTAEHFPDRTLVVMWPTEGDAWAEKALRGYRGQWFIYAGPPAGGFRVAQPRSVRAPELVPRFAGTGAFHRLIAREWEGEAWVPLPSWPGQPDALTVYRRRVP